MAVVGPFIGMVSGGLLSQIDGDFIYGHMETPKWVST